MSAVMVEERRGIEEALGCAANAVDLTVREHSGPVDYVIGLGMAVAQIARHPGRRPELREVERELVPAILRLKAGGQGQYTALVVGLFAEWMIRKGRFTEAERALAEVFAGRVVHEWLYEVCPECGGAGVLERVRNRWLRPQGNMSRNPYFGTCTLCRGSRRALAKHGERARDLGLKMKEYDLGEWRQRFTVALVSLDALTGRLNGAIAKRLRRV